MAKANAEPPGTGASGSIPGKAASATPRRIPGNLPYLTGHGTLKRVLDKITEAQRPDTFNQDFMANVLKLTGGAARACIPILKRMGFLSSDGAPTELYARFKTEGGRGEAALQALRNGFPEIFKRSEYAHAADEDRLKDLIVEITGLQKSDQVAQAIRSTFNVVRSYVGKNVNVDRERPAPNPPADEAAQRDPPQLNDLGAVRLAYNINIVLPETSDLAVLNAIFRRIKENLLR
jgi:hypothetical protein